MKRIEFIEPVSAMRGNLSGNQVLVYPDNDNKAWESPHGQVNYARNYQPRFIGAKRQRDGLNYFMVRTKSAINMSPKTIDTMSIFGAVGGVYGAIHDAGLGLLVPITQVYFRAKGAGYEGSLRKWCYDIIDPALRAKDPTIVFAAGGQSFAINNPWIGTGNTHDVVVKGEVLVKFWDYLTNQYGFKFSVDGNTGVAFSGATFLHVCEDPTINVLGLKAVEYDDRGQTIYVIEYDGKYLMYGNHVVSWNEEIVAGRAYTAVPEL